MQLWISALYCLLSGTHTHTHTKCCGCCCCCRCCRSCYCCCCCCCALVHTVVQSTFNLLYNYYICNLQCIHLRNLRAQFSQHLHKHFTDFFSHGIIRTHRHTRVKRDRESARAKSNTLRRVATLSSLLKCWLLIRDTVLLLLLLKAVTLCPVTSCKPLRCYSSAWQMTHTRLRRTSSTN